MKRGLIFGMFLCVQTFALQASSEDLQTELLRLEATKRVGRGASRLRDLLLKERSNTVDEKEEACEGSSDCKAEVVKERSLEEREALNREFLEAAKANDLYSVNTMLMFRKPDVNFQDEDGMSALHYSAIHGNIQLYKELIEHDANPKLLCKNVPYYEYPNKRIDEEVGVLHIAAKNGHAELVEFILKGRPLHYVKNEDVIIKTKKGFSPLDYAIISRFDFEDRSYSKVAQLLISDARSRHLNPFYGRITPASIATHRNAEPVNFFTALFLIRADSDSFISYKDEDNNSPLHLAILAKNKKLIDLLVGIDGVDPDATNINGKTVFDYAEKESLCVDGQDMSDVCIKLMKLKYRSHKNSLNFNQP